MIRILKKTILAAAALALAAAVSHAAILFTSDEGNQRHIYSIEPGGAPAPLTGEHDPDLMVVYNMYPAVSADGSKVAYASYRIYTDEGLRQWKQWNGQPLFAMEEHYIYFYSYFPSRTYYTRHKSLNWNIYFKDLKTDQTRKISNFLWSEVEPQFMKRGSDMMYVLTAEESAFVLRGSKSGRSFKQITLKDNQAVHPQISPDGRRLLYQSYRHGNWDIFTMKMAELPSGREETALTKTSLVSEVYPRWMPDGNSVFFLANRATSQGAFDVYVMDLEKKETLRLTDGDRVGPDAVASPAGDRVAYLSGRDGRYALAVIGADGADRKVLTGKKDSVRYPAWSPDGTQLVFLSRSNKSGKYYLYTIGADGTGMEPVSDMPCELSPPVWY